MYMYPPTVSPYGAERGNALSMTLGVFGRYGRLDLGSSDPRSICDRPRKQSCTRTSTTPREEFRMAFSAAGVERKAAVLAEVRDGIEVVLTGEYEHFLGLMVAPLLGLLSGTAPQFSDTPTQRARHLALVIVSRLPPNQVGCSSSTEVHCQSTGTPFCYYGSQPDVGQEPETFHSLWMCADC